MVFGKRKAAKPPVEEDNTPDLEVNMGMPGFIDDKAPQTMPEKTPTGIPGFGSVGAPLPQTPVAQEQAEVQKAVVAPVPVPAQPVIPEQYQIIAAEITPEGLFRYVIVTNKSLGDVGGVYDI